MSEPAADEVMGKIAGVVHGSPVAAARALRPDVVRFTQASDDAVFRPKSEAGFSRAERALAALRIARLLADTALIRHYEGLVRLLDLDGRLGASAKTLAPAESDCWAAILAHIDRLTLEPGASRREHIAALGKAGLSPQAVVVLSQLIAYVNYQSRALAGLAVIGNGDSKGAAVSGELPPTMPMRDFTKGELRWEPWLEPVDLDQATPEQRDALKITPSNRAIGAYALVLAHDPDTVKERSPLYNAIMFGPRGLPRADRELSAVVASRINGCAYCASVHAKRFIELAKVPEIMERLHRDGLAAKLDERRHAIVAYAAKLTVRPATLRPADAGPLRAVGLSDGDILDLTYPVAMFGWANRLMQSLGGSV